MYDHNDSKNKMSFSLWGIIALGIGTRISRENLGGTRWPSFYYVKS